MGLLRKLGEKSWLTEDGEDFGAPEERPHAPAARIGLRIYFAIATMLFLLLTMAYVMRMGMAGHGMSMGDGNDWQVMPKPRLLWFNTGVLVLSSVAWQWARMAGHRGRLDGLRTGLIAGGALALLFLAGQITVWRELAASGYLLTSNVANAFFYLITAIHGAHILGGLFVWARTTARVVQGAEPAEVQLSVELCAVYWHFLLLVWLAMYALLLTT